METGEGHFQLALETQHTVFQGLVGSFTAVSGHGLEQASGFTFDPGRTELGHEHVIKTLHISLNGRLLFFQQGQECLVIGPAHTFCRSQKTGVQCLSPPPGPGQV